MNGPIPFVEALRAELLAAAARQLAAGHPIRPRSRLAPLLTGTAAAVAACVLAVVVTVSRPSIAQAEIRVEREGGRVRLSLVELEHDPARIERAVRAAGLDVDVVAVPVGPSLVGRFVTEAGRGALPAELREIGGDGHAFAGFSLPEGWAGSLDLAVGRPARAGEPYVAHTDAFAPGEPLHCSGALGRTAADAEAIARRKGLDALFEVAEPLGSSHVARGDPRGDLRERGLAHWMVVEANALSAQKVLVVLAPPGSPPPHAVDPC